MQTNCKSLEQVPQTECALLLHGGAMSKFPPSQHDFAVSFESGSFGQPGEANITPISEVVPAIPAKLRSRTRLFRLSAWLRSLQPRVHPTFSVNLQGRRFYAESQGGPGGHCLIFLTWECDESKLQV